MITKVKELFLHNNIRMVYSALRHLYSYFCNLEKVCISYHPRALKKTRKANCNVRRPRGHNSYEITLATSIPSDASISLIKFHSCWCFFLLPAFFCFFSSSPFHLIIIASTYINLSGEESSVFKAVCSSLLKCSLASHPRALLPPACENVNSTVSFDMI